MPTGRNFSESDGIVSEQTYKGYTVRWMGWRESPNQFVIFGSWLAWAEDMSHHLFLYSTTLGHVGSGGELDPLDLRIVDPGDVITPRNDTPALRKRLKVEALSRLYNYIDLHK